MMLTDLADAARASGLRVIELPGWSTNKSAGDFEPDGVLCHHTGSYDAIADAKDDRDYAEWLAFRGRDDLAPPLCNLALSAECVVYVCAAGNANHAGRAKASGPMPAAADGSAIYLGIEAMNSGSQGWASRGVDAAGRPLTQGEAYARLCAGLCLHYGWPASHVRGHKETSVTGKWDPGLLDMNSHRTAVAALMEDDMATPEEIARAVMKSKIGLINADGSRTDWYFEAILRKLDGTLNAHSRALEALARDDLTPEQLRQAVQDALADAVVDVDVNVNQKES